MQGQRFCYESGYNINAASYAGVVGGTSYSATLLLNSKVLLDRLCNSLVPYLVAFK